MFFCLVLQLYFLGWLIHPNFLWTNYHGSILVEVVFLHLQRVLLPFLNQLFWRQLIHVLIRNYWDFRLRLGLTRFIEKMFCFCVFLTESGPRFFWKIHISGGFIGILKVQIHTLNLGIFWWYGPVSHLVGLKWLENRHLLSYLFRWEKSFCQRSGRPVQIRSRTIQVLNRSRFLYLLRRWLFQPRLQFIY